MKSEAKTPEAYISALPAERLDAVRRLRKTIREHLPEGFEEIMNYGMIGYVVPHSLYPPGYHCDPKLPLPFLNLASQKNYIALYHMGLYSDPGMLDWFREAYAALEIGKLDMGKSCIRFKNPDRIPFELVGKLCTKMSPEDWIQRYEESVRDSRKKTK